MKTAPLRKNAALENGGTIDENVTRNWRPVNRGCACSVCWDWQADGPDGGGLCAVKNVRTFGANKCCLPPEKRKSYGSY